MMRYAGSLKSWVVLPELGYLIITRDRSYDSENETSSDQDK